MMQRTRRLPVLCCAIGMSMLLLPTMILKTSSPSVPSLSSSFHHTTANYNSVLRVHVGIDAVDDTNAAVVASIVPYTDGTTMVLDNSDESFGDKEDVFDFVVMEPEPVLFILPLGAGVATTATTATATAAATTTTFSSKNEKDKASRHMIATTATTSSSGVPETKTTNTTFGDSFIVFPPRPNKAFEDFLVFWKKWLIFIFYDLISAAITWCILPSIFLIRTDGVQLKQWVYAIALPRILFVIFFSSLNTIPLINLAQGLIHSLILLRVDVRLVVDMDQIQQIQLAYADFRDRYGSLLWLLVVSLFFSRRAQTSV